MSRSTVYQTVTLLLTASLLIVSLVLTLLLLSPNGQHPLITSTTQGFGIGFDLTPSYGTVAVAYPNGPINSIAKIEGDAAYKEMMFRLSLGSSKTTHQPYIRVGDGLVDYPRHLWRKARKSLGLPASSDVGTLSRMISALRIEASTFVGQPITAATISIPFLAALYGEDTVDAFEYLSLTNIEFYSFKKYFPIHSFSSVYLVNGRELVPCTDDSNRTACPIPGQPLRESEFNAMTVSYTYSSLTAGLSFFTTCYSGYKYGQMSSGIADMHLGYDARHGGKNGEGQYWEKVKYVLREAILRESSRITKIIVWGDAAAEPKFVEVLKEVVEEVVDCKRPEFITNDPVYSGARGSSEFTKRALNAPGEQGSISEGQEEL